MRYRVSWGIYILQHLNTSGESTTCLWQWFNDNFWFPTDVGIWWLVNPGHQKQNWGQNADAPSCLPLQCELPSINRKKDAAGSHSAWPHTSTFRRAHKISNLAEWQIPKLCPINKLYWTSCDFCLQAPGWLIIGQHWRKWSEHKQAPK